LARRWEAEEVLVEKAELLPLEDILERAESN
jgi:hypothetical protein